ncbi:cellulose-binding protein [Streptomyces sp. NPDC007984]|uniref:cellulose-binding protein n=1 Tax=Streptomyces sp. NPDC007984 TaxID=3364801 RepID=UPI0036E8CB1E
MSSATASSHGFRAVRGRGYRPEQVDAYADALSAERDTAWERAARLTVLARRMDEELQRLREAVAGLAPQTYDTLGERARRLFELGEQEATAVREGALADARQQVDAARSSAAVVRESARAYADAVRADGDERARQRLLAAHAEADEIRGVTGREAEEERGEAVAALREMRQRTFGMLAEQDKERAERWAAVEREEAAREAESDAQGEEALARAEEALSDAERAFADAEDSARDMEDVAHAHAAELVARAREHAETVAEETNRLLAEHADQRNAAHSHIDRIHTSLTAWAEQTAPKRG